MKCIFRHDQRTLGRVHRRHYTLHLDTFEVLFGNTMSEDKAKRAFLRHFVPETHRLSVFTEIHDSFTGESPPQSDEDDELSNDDMVKDLGKRTFGK